MVPNRCSVERLLSAGYSVQVLSTHLGCGGSDIRKLCRTQLLKLGAPIQAARGRNTLQKGEQRKQHPHTGFTAWANAKQRQARMAADIGSKPLGDRSAYRERYKHLRDEWGTWSLVARARYRAPDVHDDHNDGLSYADRIGTKLFGIRTEEYTHNKRTPTTFPPPPSQPPPPFIFKCYIYIF